MASAILQNLTTSSYVSVIMTHLGIDWTES